MANKNVTLKDHNGNVLYPVTLYSNVSGIDNQLNNKANKDLSNVSYPTNTAGSTSTGTADRVITTYISSDGLTWARIWASGWKEMGGTLTATGGWATCTLPYEYSNANYTIIGTYTKSGEEAASSVFRVASKTKSSFRYALMWNNYNTGGYSTSPDTGDWYSCGY